jgi:hypothetical protein
VPTALDNGQRSPRKLLAAVVRRLRLKDRSPAGDKDKGRPLRLDEDAESADPSLPAFLARPSEAPVYHGFPVLDDVEVDGFKFGMITDFEAGPASDGDAFVVAPDGSRAGLVWKVFEGDDWGDYAARYFEEVCPIEKGRWGVWTVPFPLPMGSRDNVRQNLASALPLLRPKWEEWRRRFGPS